MDDWKSEYDKLLLSGRGDTKELIALSDAHFPGVFYKYRSFDSKGRWRDWLRGNVYATAPSEFNDPFDCIVNCDEDVHTVLVLMDLMRAAERKGVTLTDKEIACLKESDALPETFCRLAEQHGLCVNWPHFTKLCDISQYASRLQHKLYVACLSKVNNSVLMWSHYAKNHTGFCIAYDFTSYYVPRQLIYPVTYTDNRTLVDIPAFERNKWVYPTLLTKSGVWAYEEEWRFIGLGCMDNVFKISNEGTSLAIPCTPIPAVYLGAKCDMGSKHVKELLEIAEESKIKVFKMKPSATKYAVSPESL